MIAYLEAFKLISDEQKAELVAKGKIVLDPRHGICLTFAGAEGLLAHVMCKHPAVAVLEMHRELGFTPTLEMAWPTDPKMLGVIDALKETGEKVASELWQKMFAEKDVAIVADVCSSAIIFSVSLMLICGLPFQYVFDLTLDAVFKGEDFDMKEALERFKANNQEVAANTSVH